MSVDYSQWGEQKYITEFFHGLTGKFLDLGAFDGLTGSNTRGLSDLGWHGVLVEPSPFIFQRLIENHAGNDKMSFVNAAVMPENGLVTFYDSGSQLATCKQDHLVSEYVKRKYSVSGIMPECLIPAFGNTFDFVSLDVEGLDAPVLRAMGPILEHTKLLCVEDSIPGTVFNEDYYSDLMDVCKYHGFTKVVGRTYAESKPANTILSKQ